MNQVCSGPSSTKSEKPTRADGPICAVTESSGAGVTDVKAHLQEK